MRTILRVIPALLASAALVFGAAQPVVAQGFGTTVRFCRDVPDDFSCQGMSTVFAPTDDAVWVLFRLRWRSPYTLTVEWVAPSGVVYETFVGRVTGEGYYWWRLRLAIRGTRAASLLGEWTVRVTTDTGFSTMGKFTLQGP